MSWHPRSNRAVGGYPVDRDLPPDPPSIYEGSAGIGRPPVHASLPPHVELGEGIAHVSAQLEDVKRALDAVLRALGQVEV
jgi:hypothetical protein